MENTCSVEEAKGLILHLGFVQSLETQTDIKLLEVLADLLRTPETEEILLSNVLHVLKAIMKLASYKLIESSISSHKMIDISVNQHSISDYAAVGRESNHDISTASPIHNLSSDRSMLFNSFFTQPKKLTFIDGIVTISARDQ